MAKILVIEDAPLNMKLTTLILSTDGHEVLQAGDAELGMDLARKHQPALILMDIQLPQIDGLQATRILKADPATAHIKIIALTAHAMNGDEDAMRAAGCDNYLPKPFRRQQLLAIVHEMLS